MSSGPPESPSQVAGVPLNVTVSAVMPWIVIFASLREPLDASVVAMDLP
jgi:hypothetical protein